VHKYKNWSTEVKNIYDNYSDIKIVITGSSILELLKGRADLSRRISSYKLENLSLREFIKLDLSIELPVISLNDIITNISGALWKYQVRLSLCLFSGITWNMVVSLL